MAKIGFAIVAVILVSGLFSFWQEYRVERTLAALRELLPQKVKDCATAGSFWPQKHLVPGDIVLLGQGDNIPADCRLLEAFGARINNAPRSPVSPCRACATQAPAKPMID